MSTALLKYSSSGWWFVPEAEAFFVNLDFQKRKFVTFYPERVGSATKIWKYIIAKGVRGFIPEAEAYFVNLDFQRRKFVTFGLQQRAGNTL